MVPLLVDCDCRILCLQVIVWGDSNLTGRARPSPARHCFKGGRRQSVLFQGWPTPAIRCAISLPIASAGPAPFPWHDETITMLLSASSTSSTARPMPLAGTGGDRGCDVDVGDEALKLAYFGDAGTSPLGHGPLHR
uniref:Uncharacterized protein n=1 Tax=Pseudo-nitzschia australis TaxID=44445 RepID=A0A7S4EM22_9STRA